MRFVYRHFPFLGEESVWAAEASECAAEQGRFWEYHDRLYAEWRGEGSGAYTKDNLKLYASQLGLDTQVFNACIDSDRYRERVLAERDAGRSQGVTSTPTLFVNDRMVVGNQPFDVFRSVIEEELQ